MQAVFLHAFGADRLSWAGTTPFLPGVDAVTPDLPGHGLAVNDLGDGSFGDLADRLSARLEGVEGAWLVGHSLGGALAMELAARAPARWAGLILLAPLGLGQGLRQDQLSRYAEISDEAEMAGYLKSLVVRKAVIAPQFVSYAMAALERPGARAALTTIACQLGAIEAAAAGRASDLQGMDVTVIWGGDDPVASPDNHRIETLGTLVELPATGHIAHVEALKEVNRIIALKMVAA